MTSRIVMLLLVGILLVGCQRGSQPGATATPQSKFVSTTIATDIPTSPPSLTSPSGEPTATPGIPTLPEGKSVGTAAGVMDTNVLRVGMHGIVWIVQLLGIDTPQSGDQSALDECYGSEASAFVRQQVPRGSEVTVETDAVEGPHPLYQQVYLWLPDGRMLNEELLYNGYAEVSQEYTGLRYADRLLAAERAAREEQRGLWSACEPTATP